eukprot:4976975-Pyramimonas_sp.AAC.1
MQLQYVSAAPLACETNSRTQIWPGWPRTTQTAMEEGGSDSDEEEDDESNAQSTSSDSSHSSDAGST